MGIVMNMKMPHNCRTCEVREKIGCKIAENEGIPDDKRANACPIDYVEKFQLPLNRCERTGRECPHATYIGVCTNPYATCGPKV